MMKSRLNYITFFIFISFIAQLFLPLYIATSQDHNLSSGNLSDNKMLNCHNSDDDKDNKNTSYECIICYISANYSKDFAIDNNILDITQNHDLHHISISYDFEIHDNNFSSNFSTRSPPLTFI